MWTCSGWLKSNSLQQFCRPGCLQRAWHELWTSVVNVCLTSAPRQSFACASFAIQVLNCHCHSVFGVFRQTIAGEWRSVVTKSAVCLFSDCKFSQLLSITLSAYKNTAVIDLNHDNRQVRCLVAHRSSLSWCLMTAVSSRRSQSATHGDHRQQRRYGKKIFLLVELSSRSCSTELRHRLDVDTATGHANAKSW